MFPLVVFWDKSVHRLPDRLGLAQLLAEAIKASEIRLWFRCSLQEEVLTKIAPIVLSTDGYYAVVPKTITKEVERAAQMADVIAVYADTRGGVHYDIESGKINSGQGERYWLAIMGENGLSQRRRVLSRFVPLAIRRGLMPEVARIVLEHSYDSRPWEALISRLTSSLGRQEDFYFFRHGCMAGLFPLPTPEGIRETLGPILTSAEETWVLIEQGAVIPATTLLAPRPYPVV